MFFKKTTKKRGTRRSQMRKRPTGRFDFFVLWMRRFGIALGSVILVLWVGAWLWLSGSIHNAADWSKNQAIQISANNGFTVENILVEGRVNTDPYVLLGLINVQQGDPLLSFNPETAKDLISRVTWVENVRVERRLPDTIYVELTERVPMALYQKNQKLILVDRKGKSITDYNLRRFQDLLLITGEGAPENAAELVDVLSIESDVASHIAAASYVAKRRWNLKTNSGITIKLPAEDIGLALRRLAMMEADKSILGKDLQHIDLREPDRIIIQAVPGKVQEYSIEQFKAGYSASGNNI